VKILLVNWNDRENPYAGGAEVHLHEIFGRLVRRGHAVDLVASGWRGAAPRAELDGIQVYRTGRRYTFPLLGRAAVRRRLRARAYDVLVEDLNKIPLYLAGMTSLPLSVLVHHLFGSTIFQEAALPVASLVWLAERPLPWAYRRAAFQAVSESTRADLVARGVPRERIEVIPEGIDTAWFCPDGGTPRAARPTFLYVGRLKRYKGLEIALRAVAEVRRTGADVVLEIAGQGDDRARLERLADELGLAAAARGLGGGLSQPQGRLGSLQRRGRGVRHPRARLRQSGAAGVGAARGNGFPGAARRRGRPGRAAAGARRRCGARDAAGSRGAGLRGTAVLGACGRGDRGTSPPGHRSRRLTMRTAITARHCDIPDELRARAQTLLQRLTKLAPRAHDAQVLFVQDHGTPTVEVRLHTARGAVYVGTAGAADLRTALDRAVAKVRRQLDKLLTGGRRRAAVAHRVLERKPR
jgi:ribosome-associated translation inhibitor RaiA